MFWWLNKIWRRHRNINKTATDAIFFQKTKQKKERKKPQKVFLKMNFWKINWKQLIRNVPSFVCDGGSSCIKWLFPRINLKDSLYFPKLNWKVIFWSLFLVLQNDFEFEAIILIELKVKRCDASVGRCWSSSVMILVLMKLKKNLRDIQREDFLPFVWTLFGNFSLPLDSLALNRHWSSA